AELGDRCVDALRGAARAEVFRGNARAAAPLLERALAIERRPELLVDLGEVLRDLSDFPGARRVLDEAAANGTPAIAAHARALALWVELQSDTDAELDRVA